MVRLQLSILQIHFTGIHPSFLGRMKTVSNAVLQWTQITLASWVVKISAALHFRELHWWSSSWQRFPNWSWGKSMLFLLHQAKGIKRQTGVLWIHHWYLTNQQERVRVGYSLEVVQFFELAYSLARCNVPHIGQNGKLKLSLHFNPDFGGQAHQEIGINASALLLP